MKTIIFSFYLAFLLTGCNSDTTKKVEEKKEDKQNDLIKVAKGKKLFLKHCTTCHSIDTLLLMEIQVI